MASRDHLRQAVLTTLRAHPGGLTARELQGLLEGREVAVTTVITVLDRLRTDGLVTREKVGRSYRHHSVVSGEEELARALSEALQEAERRGLVITELFDNVDPAVAEMLAAGLDGRCACGPPGCGCPPDCPCRGTTDRGMCTCHHPTGATTEH